MKPAFHRGLKTLIVPPSLHKKNRERLSRRLLAHTDVVKEKSFVLLKGGETAFLYCTDRERLFRQESYFHWTFGVEEPDCLGVVEVASAKSTLFVPRLSEDYAIWQGALRSLEDFRKKYETDEVFYVDEIPAFFEERTPSLIYLLEGINSDSNLTSVPASFDGINAYRTDRKLLYPEISDLRVVKTPEEIGVIRYANEVSSHAHKLVMRTVRPGMKEYQLESLFLHHCYSVGGARHVCYTCIAATGFNSSILHYGHAGAPNNRTLEDGDMALFDMGCEYNCYCSDITCSFPVNGRFSEKQKIIYSAVYEANQAVMKAIKPGVHWTDMHILAERVIISHLKKANILKGDIDAMVDARLGYYFMPHGLGHLMGCDVHDVGGYLDSTPKRPTEQGLRSLRTARQLQENMVLTVEPGCYFIDVLLDKAIADPKLKQFLNVDQLNTYRNFGGVRIEDNVVITSTGCENLSQVPRTIKEIETWMASK